MKEIKSLIIISVFVSTFLIACKDDATPPGIGDTIKLSSYTLSLSKSGGEANTTAQYDKWGIDETMPFAINGIEIDKTKDVTIKKVSKKISSGGDAIMVISEITGSWFEIKIEAKNISVTLPENTTGKNRVFSFWITDLRNYRNKVVIKQD